MINQPASKQELNEIIRSLTTAVRTSLDNIKEFKMILDGVPDANLIAAGGGYEYTQAQVTEIRAAITDLDKLRQIAEGLATQAAASDFYFNARKVWGFNPVRR